MPQLRLELDDTRYTLLQRYAEAECRSPTEQATWLVWEALRARTATLEREAKYAEALRQLEATPQVVPSVFPVQEESAS